MLSYLKPIGTVALCMTTMMCASSNAEDRMKDAEVRSKEFYYWVVDKSTYTVSFDERSSKLSQTAKNSLKALFLSLSSEVHDGEIVIAAWSDKDFPMKNESSLLGPDRALATARANVVKDFVQKQRQDLAIVTMNMAEQNHVLAPLLEGSESQVKAAMQSGETDSRKTAAISRELKSRGGPGKVVVLVRKAHQDSRG